MYEAIEHWKQYKQDKEKRAMQMTPFLIKLVKEKQALAELEKDFNLKTRVLDYSVSNQISNILFKYINNNK